MIFVVCFLTSCSQPAQQNKINELNNRVTQLEDEISALKSAKPTTGMPLYSVESALIGAENKKSGGTAPSSGGTIPPFASAPAPTNVVSDIGCRPKLVFATEPDPNDPKKVKLVQREPTQQPLPMQPYCRPLNPLTRLLLEHLTAGFTENYTNVAGYPGVGSPIVQQTGNTYQFGVGYSQKPILKDLRNFFVKNQWNDYDYNTTNEQGTLSEDLLYNAVQMNAGLSYGKTLTIKNGTAIQALNSRPSYGVGLSYSLDLERMWIHAIYPDARPADAGYYYYWNPSQWPSGR